MARLIIGKLIFGKDDFLYGLELCLHKAGRSAYAVTEKTVFAVDVLLVSMFWYRDVYLLELFLRKSGLKGTKNRPVIIAGGMQATMTPKIVAQMVDYVFVGDADDYLGGILDQIEKGEIPDSQYLVNAETEALPLPAECPPSPFALSKGGARSIVRIEIARGCRYKCAFCVLSGLKPYQEVSADAVIGLLKETLEGGVSLFAPDRTSHSEWGKLQDFLLSQGRKDYGQDVRLEKLDIIQGASATFGLEGISYRLRKSIGKSFKDDLILRKMEAFVANNDRPVMLSMYLIADLPGESKEDWAEFYALFEKIEAQNWSRWLTLKPVLNPLSPKAFTPLAGTTIHPFRDYRRIWQDFLRKGGNGKWGFRVVETLVWGPFERIQDVLVQEGKSEAYKLISGMPNRWLSGKVPGKEKMACARHILKKAADAGILLPIIYEPQ